MNIRGMRIIIEKISPFSRCDEPMGFALGGHVLTVKILSSGVE